MNDSDEIIIRGLSVSCHVGVPDEERAQPQELRLHVTMSPYFDPAPLDDDIARTVDYHSVAQHIERVAVERPRKLIETLAEDLATEVLENFAVSRVTIEIEKFVLPNTSSVGVHITRSAQA